MKKLLSLLIVALVISCAITLASCGHVHTEEIIPAVEATCTQAGLTEGTKCSSCDEILVAQQPVALKAHVEVTIDEISATCTSTGLTSGKKCSVCGAIFVEQKEIPMTTHTYDDKYDESCNGCGFIRDVECNHAETEIVLGYEATCTSTGLTDGEKCKKCGELLVAQDEIPLKQHTSSNWIVDVEPTKSDMGQHHKECTICGYTIVSEILPAIGSDGLEYSLNYDRVSYSVSGIGTCADRRIAIPSSYNDKPVTSIGMNAFFSCTSLISVVIPDSVKSIGAQAFQGCTSLTNVVIPNSVKRIGTQAFSDCISLKSIEIPDSVTSIGDWAFFYCCSFTSIEIPNSVTSIGGSAFAHCTSLTSIEIPNSVTSIAEYAFESCTSLTGIEIPNSVTSIGGGAFKSCTSLASIEIPYGVTSIGTNVFSCCTSLAIIEVEENNEYYKSIDGNLYSKDGKTLIYYAMGKEDTSFTIPDHVTSIGNYAFYGCTSLKSIVIPNTVKSVGNYAFYDCPSLAIYCEAASQPREWNSSWNPSNCPVVWGYKGE